MQLLYVVCIKRLMEQAMKLVKTIAALLFLAASLTACKPAETGTVDEITVEQVKQKLADSADVVLLDVRTEGEFSGELGHLPDAVLIPIQELDDRIEELDKFRGKEIIVYCRSGNRSGIGTEMLIEHGFKAYNMLGGMIEWNEKYGRPDDHTNQK